MGEGGGGRGEKSSLFFSLPSFPFSPRNARYSGYRLLIGLLNGRFQAFLLQQVQSRFKGFRKWPRTDKFFEDPALTYYYSRCKIILRITRNAVKFQRRTATYNANTEKRIRKNTIFASCSAWKEPRLPEIPEFYIKSSSMLCNYVLRHDVKDECYEKQGVILKKILTLPFE